MSAFSGMEMTMRKKILAVLAVPLIAALTAQAAAASAHHRVVASERWRNSNAYFAAPGNSNEYFGFGNQEALRAAHWHDGWHRRPGPGLTTDHRMHGYNG
jgi:hypothetical protein